jgi:hypothetical protein
MKRAVIIGIGVGVAALAGVLAIRQSAPLVPTPTPTPTLLTQRGQCDASIWQHVYAGDPRRFKTPQDRLHVIQDCITVTGVLFSSKPEPDGDLHIRLTLDLGEENLLNDKNRTDQMGKLVIEPVCERIPTQRDVVEEKACDGYTLPLKIPAMGKHVSVTGPLVLDEEHGWLEVHGPTSIVEQ